MAFQDIVDLVSGLSEKATGYISQAIVHIFGGEYAENGVTASAFLSELRDAGVKISNQAFSDIYATYQQLDQITTRIANQPLDEPLRETLFTLSPYDQTGNYRYLVEFTYTDNATGETKFGGRWHDSNQRLSPNDILSGTIDEFENAIMEANGNSDITITGARVTNAFASEEVFPTSGIFLE